MNIDEALATIDGLLQPLKISTLQELIFRECWEGKTYLQIAQKYDYDSNYIRSIGSRLWQLLSENFQEELTKNNFRSILRAKFAQKLPNNSSLDVIDRNNQNEAISSDLYIERPPLEKNCLEAISAPGALVNIKAGPRMGKTLLLNRTLNFLNSEYYVVKIDLLQAEKNTLKESSKLLRWIFANISMQLAIKNLIACYWNKDLGAKVIGTVYMENYILTVTTKPLILAIDSLEILFEYGEVAREFISLLCFWHEKAKDVFIWEKLRIITVQSTEHSLTFKYDYLFYNAGVTINLPKFNQQQVLNLANKYQLLKDKDFRAEEIKLLSQLIDGHPYLAKLALQSTAKYNLNLTKLLAEASTEASIFIELLLHYLQIFYEHTDLARAFKQVVLSDSPVQLESFFAYQLENLGLISLQGNEVTPSCQLYRLYFKDRLVRF